MQNIWRNVQQPTPSLVAKVLQRNLDYVKNLQAKYFTGENIPIYGIYMYVYVWIIYMHAYMHILSYK